MIFCIDCKHHRLVHHRFTFEQSHGCDVDGRINPVTGDPIYGDCEEMRKHSGRCGTFAKLFKPKEEGKK